MTCEWKKLKILRQKKEQLIIDQALQTFTEAIAWNRIPGRLQSWWPEFLQILCTSLDQISGSDWVFRFLLKILSFPFVSVSLLGFCNHLFYIYFCLCFQLWPYLYRFDFFVCVPIFPIGRLSCLCGEVLLSTLWRFISVKEEKQETIRRRNCTAPDSKCAQIHYSTCKCKNTLQ